MLNISVAPPRTTKNLSSKELAKLLKTLERDRRDGGWR